MVSIGCAIDRFGTGKAITICMTAAQLQNVRSYVTALRASYPLRALLLAALDLAPADPAALRTVATFVRAFPAAAEAR